MRLVTYANRPHPGVELLRASCMLQQIDLQILGFDGKPCGHGDGSFASKLDAQKTFFHELAELNPEELIVFVDAFDVVVVESAETITKCAEALLKVSGAKAVFAAESFESPVRGLPWEHRKTFSFLNSGGFAGRAADLDSLFTQEVRTNDDQLFYQARLFEDPSTIALDYGCLLFACMNGAQALPRADGGAIMAHSHTMPCILHFQGFEKNVLPFVPPSLRPLAAKIQNLKRPHPIRDSLERLGDTLPSIQHPRLRHPFWRGLSLCLLILLLILLNIS